MVSFFKKTGLLSIKYSVSSVGLHHSIYSECIRNIIIYIQNSEYNKTFLIKKQKKNQGQFHW